MTEAGQTAGKSPVEEGDAPQREPAGAKPADRGEGAGPADGEQTVPVNVSLADGEQTVPVHTSPADGGTAAGNGPTAEEDVIAGRGHDGTPTVGHDTTAGGRSTVDGGRATGETSVSEERPASSDVSAGDPPVEGTTSTTVVAAPATDSDTDTGSVPGTKSHANTGAASDTDADPAAGATSTDDSRAAESSAGSTADDTAGVAAIPPVNGPTSGKDPDAGSDPASARAAVPMGPVGQLVARLDRTAGGYAVDLGLYGLSAVFALITAYTSTLLPHRAWGAIAAWAYAGAFVLAAGQFLGYRLLPPRRPGSPGRTRLAVVAYAMVGSGGRAALSWTTWAAAALLPLVVAAVQRAGGRSGRAQEEVLVVERMGERLLDGGTPYVGREAIAALPLDERLMAYSPYQPGMALFGLPRAIAGAAWWTDARVWFAVATVIALVAAVAMLRGGRITQIGRVRAIQAATVLPLCALTLATGGDDIPVLALCLLALACAATDRYGWAGVAVGAAAACKLFAWPVVAVLAVLAMATGRGNRLLPGALGLPILVLVPPFQVDQDAFLENVIRFPLGHGLVTSPAQSPFPGYLIAQGLPGGRFIAVGLLLAVAAAITVRILFRPPRTAASAALICGWGVLAAILLMPTTRFGYLLYPLALLVWAGALRIRPRDSGTTQLQVARGNDTALYRL